MPSTTPRSAPPPKVPAGRRLSPIPPCSALAGATLGALAIFFVGAVLFVMYSTRLRRSFEDRRLLGLAREELRQAEKEITSGETDFASLWAVTQKRLDYYHKIATTRSERSFLYGQIAAGIGFVVLLTVSVIAGFAASPTASVTVGAVGIVGGGLGAYAGKTFMKSQEAAAAQLREYFLQPLEFSKYLAAERILELLDEKDRTSSVRLLIEAIATGSSSRSVATSDSDSPPN